MAIGEGSNLRIASPTIIRQICINNFVLHILTLLEIVPTIYKAQCLARWWWIMG